MKHVLAACLLLTLAAIPHVAPAADSSLDLSAGTLGLSAGLVQPLGSASDLRLVYGTASLTRTDHFSNLVIDVTANLAVHENIRTQTAGIYFDRGLRHGPVHVTAGAIYNLNTVTGTSIPTNTTVVISGVAYSQAAAGVIFTTVRWPALAPYVGIGFAPPRNGPRRIGLFGDAGLYYQGRPRVTFAATGAIEANVVKFQPYFDEGRRQLASELAPAQVFPVVQIGARIPL